MGQYLIKKKAIKVFDLTLPDKCFGYLRFIGEIIYRRDEAFNIIRLKIRAEG